MNIFVFLFYLGIISIIFSFLWKWVVVLPAAVIFTLIKMDNFGMKAVKIFGTYLLVSLIAVLTLNAIGEEPSWLTLIFYPIVGAFVILMSYASNQYELQKQARESHDWHLMLQLERDAGFETFLTFGAALLYILILFVPVIATNGLIEFLFGVVEWIFNIPVVGWLIGIGGVLFLLSMSFYGIVAFGGIIYAVISKLKGKPKAVPLEAEAAE